MYSIEEFNRPHGPLFHRWLPDGEASSISIKTTSKNIEVFTWFERCGFVQGGWIRFDYKKRETDPEIICRQGILDAGPLRVKIIIKGIYSKDIVELKKDDEGNECYIKTGKKITKIINDTIIPFINNLRLYHGQYWIQELHKWNSTKESLGSYFRKIYAKYSVDNGITWGDFIPDKLESQIRIFSILRKDFSAYLSKKCWENLNNFDPSTFVPPLSIKILQTAHQFKDEGNYKQSIIECNTALEVAIGDLFKKRFPLTKQLRKEIESFWGLSVKSQLTIISSLMNDIPEEDIENALYIVKLRNKIVHDGYSPKNDFETEKKINSLFKIVAKIISNKEIKFPINSSGNVLFPKDTEQNDI